MKSSLRLAGLFVVVCLTGCFSLKTTKPAGMVLIPAGKNAGTNLTGTVVSSSGTHSEGYSQFFPMYYSLETDGYWMDQTLITIGLWENVRLKALSYGYTDLPPAADKRPDYPVYAISWSDAVKWCNARSEVEGRAPAYYTSPEKTEVYRTGQLDLEDDCVLWDAGYRLPTMNEWEYAARGGLVGKRFPWGDTISHNNANYLSDSRFIHSYDLSEPGYHPESCSEEPHITPVRSLVGGENEFGLFDMAGNLWQWNWEWHPASPLKESRVLRGGSWGMNAGNCKVAFRTRGKPHSRGMHGGFRTVLPLRDGERKK